ncbi:AR781 [Hirschfeldia incana]|nr:AR781 [Hirschfeldia incana]
MLFYYFIWSEKTVEVLSFLSPSLILFSSLLLIALETISEPIGNQRVLGKTETEKMEVMSLSAPTSPRRITEWYGEYEEKAKRDFSDRYLIPFDWEETPGTPRKIAKNEEDTVNDDFAFEIGDKFETTSLFAEELFDGGKIKPLKPPPCLQLDNHQFQYKYLSPVSSPTPRSPIGHGKDILRKAFSPRKKPVDVDPFEVALDNTRKGVGEERGRGRHQSSSRRAARSLSPFRVSAYPWEEQEQREVQGHEQRKGSFSSIQSTSSSTCMSCKSSSSKKWRLKDLLLFRSASEGRARHNNKDFVKSFSGLFRKQEDSNTSSSTRRGSPSSSVHEFHYRAKKAEAKGLKKKTFLPYMQIGRFSF